ncbi:hypothetical protein RCIX2733 [Methanocella arvoryzae MRE50]|uniref:DUF8156 domain-containing protein n=2 Tax=Methanocella TaxID=570266 RepID=Q0W1G9_METAR|nr:hypothetical protein RCIX2733 [Methanocella arvoryzae MRE50]
MSLMKAHKRWEGYRQTLDKKRREIFDYIFFELAGRREETLVNHPDQSEAAMMNAMIEMEMRLRELESKVQK